MSSMLRSCYDHFGKLDKTDLAAYKTCDGRSVGNIIFRYCPTFSRSGLSLSLEVVPIDFIWFNAPDRRLTLAPKLQNAQASCIIVAARGA